MVENNCKFSATMLFDVGPIGIYAEGEYHQNPSLYSKVGGHGRGHAE